jgi:hypothetical protein
MKQLTLFKEMPVQLSYKPANTEDFFYWINERHRIYLTKKHKQYFHPTIGAKVLTDDPIFQQYRFCNVFRELDRVTTWIRENWREPYANHENLWFAMCIARQINWPETLEEVGFPIIPQGWDDEHVANVMDGRKMAGKKVYTGAYMIRAESDPKKPWYKWTKQQYIASVVLRKVWDERYDFMKMFMPADIITYTDVKEQFQRQPTLQEVHTWLMQFTGWGPFMAYEVVTDLRHTRYLRNAPDIMTWANAGPGAKRGLNRIYCRPVNQPLSQDKANAEMQYLLFLSQQKGHIESHVPALEMRDIEHSLCEMDKYLRVKNGEGTPRAKYVPGRGY